MDASIITIGDELLIGQVIDTNSAFIAQELSKIGVQVRRRIAVADEKHEIVSALNEAKSISQLVLITGGLGPTSDDITKQTLCEYFRSRLVLDEEILKMVRDLFAKMNRRMPESNISQAMVPDNCIPIRNYNGTAPGMWFENEGNIFVSLPGVPFEMKAMLTDTVLPMFHSKFPSGMVIIHRTIHTQGIGESTLAEKIADIENKFPKELKLAYLPNHSIVRLRITATGHDESYLREEITSAEKKLEERVGDYIFGYDDTSIEKELGEALRRQKKTIGTAESCTGGLIATKLVAIPKASDHFQGSAICYSNELKQKILGVKTSTLESFGAVSERTVHEMVEGALQVLKSDYAIVTSGIAGPDGGTLEKPVGTVWIGVGNKGKIIVKKFQFTRSREIIMEYTAITALAMAWRFVNGKLQ